MTLRRSDPRKSCISRQIYRDLNDQKMTVKKVAVTVVIVLPRKAYIIYCFTSVSKKWMQFTREHLFDFISLQHSITINSAQWKVLRGAIGTIYFYDRRKDRQSYNLKRIASQKDVCKISALSSITYLINMK